MLGFRRFGRIYPRFRGTSRYVARLTRPWVGHVPPEFNPVARMLAAMDCPGRVTATWRRRRYAQQGPRRLAAAGRRDAVGGQRNLRAGAPHAGTAVITKSERSAGPAAFGFAAGSATMPRSASPHAVAATGVMCGRHPGRVRATRVTTSWRRVRPFGGAAMRSHLGCRRPPGDASASIEHDRASRSG